MNELLWPICFFAVVLALAYAMFPRRGEGTEDPEPPSETPETRARKWSE